MYGNSAFDCSSDNDDMPPPPKEVLMQTPRTTTTSSSRPHPQKLPRFTNSLSAFSPPSTGLRLSSQRRQPYSAMMNGFNTPSSTPRLSSSSSFGIPPNKTYHRWDDVSFNHDNSLVAYETTNEFVPDYHFNRFTKQLQSKLAIEQTRINEAKVSIQNCRKWDRKQQQSWNEVCAHALLLLSEIRIDKYRALLSRVTTFHQMKKGPFPLSPDCRSTFTIFRMEVCLDRGYYLKNMGEDPNYVFILVGSTREKTIASQLIELEDNNLVRCRRFHIDEEMVFKNLPLNFRIDLSLYAMKMEEAPRTPKDVVKKMAINFIQKLSPSPCNANTSFGSSRFEEDISTKFQLVGTTSLSRATVGHCKVFFDNAVYPLDGSGEVNSKVSALPYELYAEVTGIWKFVLEDDVMNLHAELTQGFIYLSGSPGKRNQMNDGILWIIDCSSICDRSIEPMATPPPQFPYAFALEVSSFLSEGKHTGNKKYTVGFESREDLHKWINALNRVLEILRDSARMNENC